MASERDAADSHSPFLLRSGNKSRSVCVCVFALGSLVYVNHLNIACEIVTGESSLENYEISGSARAHR